MVLSTKQPKIYILLSLLFIIPAKAGEYRHTNMTLENTQLVNTVRDFVQVEGNIFSYITPSTPSIISPKW